MKIGHDYIAFLAADFCTMNLSYDHHGSSKACKSINLQAFLVFSQHLAWVYNAGKLIENVFSCLNISLRLHYSGKYIIYYCKTFAHYKLNLSSPFALFFYMGARKPPFPQSGPKKKKEKKKRQEKKRKTNKQTIVWIVFHFYFCFSVNKHIPLRYMII